MTDQAASRRLRILEDLIGSANGSDLEFFAAKYGVDDRTIRRDIDFIQQIATGISQISLIRGKVIASKDWTGAGYFGDQVERNLASKQAIARTVALSIEDNIAIGLTAGSTTFHVAREIRRRFVTDEQPKNLIAFTNSLPALSEFIGAGISTGILGEVYNEDDCAFHSHEYRSQFQPNLLIIGASGAVINLVGGSLELYSQRAEEAFFLKQLIAPVTRLVVVVDGSKIGNRHPWAFVNSSSLRGKHVKLVTSGVSGIAAVNLESLTKQAAQFDYEFEYEIVKEQ